MTDGVSLFNGTAEQGAAHEICALLGYYAAFRDNVLVLTLKDGTDRSSRIVGKELPTYVA